MKCAQRLVYRLGRGHDEGDGYPSKTSLIGHRRVVGVIPAAEYFLTRRVEIVADREMGAVNY